MRSGLTRRAALGGAGLLVAAAGSGAWALSSGVPAPGLSVLTRAEARVVDALADVLFPGVHFPVSGREAGVTREVDRIVRDVMDPMRAQGFRYLLRALEWGTLASRGRRFTDLPRADQLDVLEAWVTPEVVPRRVAAESIKAVLGMAYFAHPQVQAAMGWRTGCPGRAT